MAKSHVEGLVGHPSQGAGAPVPVPAPVPDLPGDGDGDGASVPDLPGGGDAPPSDSESGLRPRGFFGVGGLDFMTVH